MREIRVLVVDNSIIFRELLIDNLNRDSAIKVVGAARDAYAARDAIIEYQPDVMVLDTELPGLTGLDFLRKLMPQYPLPTVVVSSIQEKASEAKRAGAVEFVLKPSSNGRQQLEHFVKSELIVKIKLASMVRISDIKVAVPAENHQDSVTDNMVIAIGASTGGTEAIASVLHNFGNDIPGVVVVQHMPQGFTQMYAQRLNDECRVRVKEAKTGDRVMPGQVLIAPGGDAHMRLVKVNGCYQVECRRGDKVSGHVPSVDVLFESVAKAAGSNSIGIILTGMGSDGAKGLLAMRKAGAQTIGQDESTCIVYGMPKVAYDIGAVTYQEKLLDIPKRTYALLNRM